MIQSDYKRFNAAMLGMAKASVNRCDRLPDNDEIMIRFKFLIDLPFTQIIENGKKAMLKKAFFPGIPELSGNTESDIETEAIEAFELINSMLQKHHDPIPGKRIMAIKIKLKKMNEMRALKMAGDWCWQMITGENIQTTRAQFIKAYKARALKAINIKASKQLESGTKKKLIDHGEKSKSIIIKNAEK